MMELNLNARELLTYAIIYGFSQGETGFYYGSLNYLSHWLGIDDRSNALRYLKPLVDKGLVVKEDVKMKSNQRGCVYKTVLNNGPIIKNPDIDYIIIQPWMVQNMKLNGKDLLLFALIHGYSRKESGNVCKYNKEYFAKWLQCRKDNVDRQIKQAIKNGVIKEEKGGYVALVPDEITLPQTDNTPLNEKDIDFTQIDNTFPQTDNTLFLKLTTNNLHKENLIDNISLNNNNSNTFKYPTKEDLSVVVNKNILPMDFSIDYSAKAFTHKVNKDFELYQEYKTKTFDIADFMAGYALAAQVDLETYYANINEEGLELYEKGNDLLLKIITNKRFADRWQALLDLPDSEKTEIYKTASRLFSHKTEDRIMYNKSRPSYIIGVIENKISQNKDI